MSDSGSNADLARLAADLARSLRDLQRELDQRPSGPRPPSPREILRFTDEIAIPGIILVLETNVRALRLLQRAIRLSDERKPPAGPDHAVRERAVSVSQATLGRLDEVLADVQDAIEGRPQDEEARQVLDEARALREEIDAQLAVTTADANRGQFEADAGSDVPVDVDAELQSIKDDLDDGDDGEQ
ncbi:hypothetical protein ACFR9U_17000 [Halorientalis brevis]|uniref:Uncharacterized protein n=1 Tax=Halorientalis brevis TaxID=1126241 RepID=A0ABD6CFU4_9EURY|nr:hypothetical protein [Halorientalis brevis]